MKNQTLKISTRRSGKVKTYMFRVVVEPDEDRWVAYCPALVKYAATTWGNTREEALQHIQEAIPEEPSEEVIVSSEPRVEVTI